ncbi:MAG: polysaccharide biosynthesis protein [Firmicutes bacterium]|nr:polysaccharide biosynthesis protein [Bacillota bacterium]
MDLRINKRHIVLVVADAFLIAAAAYLGLLLRFDFQLANPYLAQTNQQIFNIIAIRLVIFYLFGLYRPLWKYASIYELMLVVSAVTFSSVIIYLYSSIILATPFLTANYIIAWFLNVTFIGGIRILVRILPHHIIKSRAAQSRVLIIGAGAAGIMVVKELQSQFATLKKLPIGFIDDDPAKQRCGIHRVKVLGTRDDIPTIIEKHNVNEVIIAIPSAPRSEIKKLTRLSSQHPVQVKIIPGVHELINGTVSINKIRSVQIEDLLGREEVKTNLTEMAQYLHNEIVLVTGAGGSIGSELCRQIMPFQPQKLLLLDHTENNVYDIEMELRHHHTTCAIIPVVADVRDPKRIHDIFTLHKPTVIFHAAAHKHVPLMEANREEAINNNINGTRNVAEAAHRHHAKSFLLISTDKAVRPSSVMGATKRVGEIIIQTLAQHSNTHYCAVRFGNVLGSRGSVIPLFKKQIEAGGPVTVTHPEMTRYFMTIPEAVQLVIQAAAMGNNGNIFILDMGEPVKICDLARDLIRLSGFEPEKDIKVTYTGIRPGEKLYEELFIEEEGNLKTTHERIFVAKPTDHTSVTFQQEIDYLESILHTNLREYHLKSVAKKYNVS